MSGIRSEPGRIWRITIDRAEARNAVSEKMLGQIGASLGDAAADPGARVVLLAGEGGHFCAGADLGEVAETAGPDGFRCGRALEDVLVAMADHSLPVVAGVQGAALGAGCQLLSAADLVVAAEDARIGIPSSRLGIVIAFESIERLVLAIGPRRAADLLITGREVSGREAAGWGLVTEAVAPDRVGERAEGVAELVASSAPLSVRGSKRAIAAVLRKLSVDRETEGYRLVEIDMMAADALASEDLREGLRARRERRPPEFRGA
ncbi:MAG: enoyl-CoA hydratase/isomerase family protein [Actinomycetota bacterium]